MGQDVAKDRNLDVGEGKEDPRDLLDTAEGQGWASAYRAAEVAVDPPAPINHIILTISFFSRAIIRFSSREM